MYIVEVVREVEDGGGYTAFNYSIDGITDNLENARRMASDYLKNSMDNSVVFIQATYCPVNSGVTNQITTLWEASE